MSLINHTVWATVSINTIKATDAYKKESHPKHSTILAALYELGHDRERTGYSKEENVAIRSFVDNKLVLTNTTLYTFPVRPNFPFINAYVHTDVIHYEEDAGFMGWDILHENIEQFGNEYDPSRDENNKEEA